MAGFEFEKWQGLGNDFIIVEAEACPEEEGSAWAQRLCPAHWGVGADGLIYALPGQAGQSQLTMEIFNADGTVAAMCGNGIRCLAAWAWARGKVDKADFAISTRAGVKQVQVRQDQPEAWSVEVDMGVPIVLAQEMVALSSGQRLPSYLVTTGNLHRVVILPEVSLPGRTESAGSLRRDAQARLSWLKGLAVDAEGQRLESSAYGDCNVEFIVPQDQELHMRVSERGVGETLACGTGACAAVVAAQTAGLLGAEATVHLRGGDLAIRVDDSHRVFMCGPAVRVFRGSC